MARKPPSQKSQTERLDPDQGSSAIRETSWLLPSNHKLRALSGISLRNLTFLPHSRRARGKTIDDDSLPTALQTRAKLLAKQENVTLEHSRSSDDLRAQASSSESSKSDRQSGAPAEGFRPTKERLRRRSTLNWTNATPEMRQHKLEDATTVYMAETWFSLHCDGLQDPIYISEVTERSMNPDFRFFDLNMYGPGVTRQEELTVKLWAKPDPGSKFMLLIELRVNMRSLQFIGKSLENFHHPLPPNCILFHLTDGIYTSFTDMPLDGSSLKPTSAPRDPHNVLPTSSFDALMRLSNLDDCIQDALATREQLSKQINEILEQQKYSQDAIDSASRAQEQLASTQRALASCRKQVSNATARRSELQASLQSRRAAIASGRLAQEKAQTQFTTSVTALSMATAQLKQNRSAVSGQIRRICEDLLHVYPIEPVDPQSLTYTIRGIQLPNVNTLGPHPDTDPVATSAALGLVAHITQLLSLYLWIPIPYPPTPRGSTSTIYDPISTSMPSAAARTFPLYQTGAVLYRFEYGVFLLNSDIELLMSRQGAKVVDLRHTLPNLKYILTVLTAGKGAIPPRKKGGVRALDNGRPTVGTVQEVVSIPEKRHFANGKAKAT